MEKSTVAHVGRIFFLFHSVEEIYMDEVSGAVAATLRS